MILSKMAKDRMLLLVFLAAILISLPWTIEPFYSRGEPREALVSQAMLRTGNWVLPRTYDGVVPSKPPFLHWLISIASLPFGDVNEFSSRLPTALAVIFFAGAFFSFIRKRRTESEALLSVLILLSCFEWWRSAVSCRVDMLFSVMLCSSILSICSWSERAFTGIPWIGGVFLAFATLTKGPVALVLWGGILGLEVLLIKRLSLVITIKAMIVCAFAVVVSGTWYYLAYQEAGEAFLNKVWAENFERFAGTMSEGAHKHSVFYLFLVFALGLMPWTLVVLTPLVKNFKSTLISIKNNYLPKNLMNLTPLERVSIVAATIIVLFFCIPESKRSVYLLPAYPFIAFSIANRLLKISVPTYLERLRVSWHKVAVYCIAVIIFLNAFILFPLTFLLSPRSWTREYLAPVVEKYDAPVYSYNRELYAVAFYLKTRIHRLLEIAPENAIVLLYRKDIKSLTEKLSGTHTLTDTGSVFKSIVIPEEEELIVYKIQRK